MLLQTVEGTECGWSLCIQLYNYRKNLERFKYPKSFSEHGSMGKGHTAMS
jgi:hypothetical protein